MQDSKNPKNYSDKYLREFIFCLKHIDLHQPILKSFKNKILTSSFLARKHLDILDVGSGEGSLIFKIAKMLLSLGGKRSISVYALEPSPHFAKLLEKRMGKINNNVCKIKTIPLTLDKFLSSGTNIKFDFILASHVFYHFSNWLETIGSLKRLLKDKSKIFIVLESIKSSQYQLKPRLYLPPNKRIDEYGKRVTAESLVNNLKNARVPFQYEELYSKLHFSPNISKAIEEILRIVAFLFRYEAKDISTQKNKADIRNFLQDKFNIKKNRFELDYVSDLIILASQGETLQV